MIRSMSEDELISNQSELVRMIEAFRSASSENLAAQRQEVLDNATETRDMLEGFLTRIGGTLDIIAGSNQVIADYLTGETDIPDPFMDEGVEDKEYPGKRDRDLGDKIERGIKRGFKNVNMQVIVSGPGGLVNE